MSRQPQAMHVARIRSGHVDRGGRRREYESRYLRRTYREDGKVRHETLANLSGLADEVVDAIEAALKGTRLVAADAAVTILRSLPHGHVAAVAAMAGKVGLPQLLGPSCRQRDLALALIISRVVHPTSKLSTLTWWADTTLGVDLGVVDATTDEIYAAMDWLHDRQDAIERTLAGRHLAPTVNPSRMALFDLTSAWLEGRCCPLAARGYSRDGKRGKTQVEYGILTDPDGRPVAVRVFDGATGDPTAFTEIVTVVRDRFGLHELVLVGDRGMITKARIADLQQLNDDPDTDDAFGWITALRAPSIARLARADGPLQLSLFDQQDLAEIAHPDYPGERLVACRNPLLATERARKRADLLAATEALLAKVKQQVDAGRLRDPDKIGVKADRALRKHKVGKHLVVQVAQGSISWHRDQAKIDAEAALDGIYVIRTSVPAQTLDAPATVAAYKNLAFVERDFRHIKADDLDLRPIWHRLADRVRGHVLLCMLACYLVWHLRNAWAPLTFTDEHPPAREDPVAPARRSPAAQAKASRKANADHQPVRGFRDLLDHLATLTRDTITISGRTVDKLTTPTPLQRRAFDLLNTPIPITLT